MAERLGAPAPSLLVLAGLVVGMLPGVPAFEVSPEVVSLVVLPPLLYAAATISRYPSCGPSWARWWRWRSGWSP